MPAGSTSTNVFNTLLGRKGLVAAVKLYKDAVWDYASEIIPNSFTDNQLFSNWASMGSLPMAPDVPEGDDTPVHTVASRWSKQLSIVKSAIMMSVTEEAFKVDQYGFVTMKAIGKLLTMSADHKQNQLAADVYNYGFTNSGQHAGWDGSALFAANHLTDAGATGVNTFGSGSTVTVTPFSATALGTAMGLFAATVNDQGDPMPILGKLKVIAPATLREPVQRTLKGTEQPGTANRETSVIHDQYSSVIVPYLTNQYNWFISSDESKVFSLTRIPRKTDFDYVLSKWQYLAAIMEEKIYNFTDWRGVFGAKGA